MTMTVKLNPMLEQALREHSVGTGRSASDVIREALERYLYVTAAERVGAYELGAELFGRFQGPADLSARRKEAFADVVHTKQRRRAPAVPR